MNNKTCGECKYRYSYRSDEDCNGRCRLYVLYRIPSNKPACSKFEPIPPPSVFDHIIQSPEALAESLVFWEGGWTSRFIQFTSTDKEEAYTATVARLKEVYNETTSN
jgi:hypothetical protein